MEVYKPARLHYQIFMLKLMEQPQMEVLTQQADTQIMMGL